MQRLDAQVGQVQVRARRDAEYDLPHEVVEHAPLQGCLEFACGGKRLCEMIVKASSSAREVSRWAVSGELQGTENEEEVS
jgi:hypothetical protein